MCSEKATRLLVKLTDILKRTHKFETISHLILHLLSKGQIMREIVSNFVAFLENLNFKSKFSLWYQTYKTCKVLK